MAFKSNFDSFGAGINFRRQNRSDAGPMVSQHWVSTCLQHADVQCLWNCGAHKLGSVNQIVCSMGGMWGHKS